jgi:hypothetical protein
MLTADDAFILTLNDRAQQATDLVQLAQCVAYLEQCALDLAKYLGMLDRGKSRYGTRKGLVRITDQPRLDPRFASPKRCPSLGAKWEWAAAHKCGQVRSGDPVSPCLTWANTH